MPRTQGLGAPFLAPGEQLGIVPPCPTLARRAAFGAPSPLLPEGQAKSYDACTRPACRLFSIYKGLESVPQVCFQLKLLAERRIPRSTRFSARRQALRTAVQIVLNAQSANTCSPLCAVDRI